MASEKLVSFLQRTALLTAGQAAAIAAEFAPLQLPKHDFLLRAGTGSDDYLFLDADLLRGFACDPAGHDVTTGFYGPGEVVFEVALLHFPFGWLPAVLVPLVVLAHVAALWQLLARPEAQGPASSCAGPGAQRLAMG